MSQFEYTAIPAPIRSEKAKSAKTPAERFALTLTAEINRMAKLGVHAITFSDNPALHGFPSIHDPYWDPMWKACADNSVVINCHIGTGAKAEDAKG